MTRPILVGCHKRRLDADRRLRLPAVWTPLATQIWLLYPPHLFPPCRQLTEELSLFPIGEESLGACIPSTFDCTAIARTFEALLEVLRDNARRFSLPPDVATAIRIDPASARFALTKAQVEWLGCRGRTLIVAGALIYGRICTPAVWARWQRGVTRHLGRSDFPRR